MTASAMAEPNTNALPAWQATAVEAYADEAQAGGVGLRAKLAAQVKTLTGCEIRANAIVTDPVARQATTTMDGVIFQLQGNNLILLRPCAYCGVGRFPSPPVANPADLGYALSGWQPYHADCEPADPDDAEW
jgi:hypothetical protein